MAKKPSLGDALSRVKALAAEPRPRPQETPAPEQTEVKAPPESIRDEPVSALPASLEAAIPDMRTTDQHVTALPRVSADTQTRSHVRTLQVKRREAGAPKGFNVRPQRIEKPHQSVYAHPAVFKVIRQIAAAEEIKPQDLYREGLRAVLSKRGYDFDKLDNGEG